LSKSRYLVRPLASSFSSCLTIDSSQAELTFASVSSPDPPPSLSNTSLSEDPALFSHNNTSPLIELKSPLSNATFVPPTCATSPADPDYNAVILYVVSSNRGTELINSLIKVYQNMALTRPWPIVLFHPGDYDNPDGRNSFRAGLLGKIGYEKDALDFLKRIEFERMHWTLPEGISSNVDEVDPVFHGEWPGKYSLCHPIQLSIANAHALAQAIIICARFTRTIYSTTLASKM
jgi:hypothetical protein